MKLLSVVGARPQFIKAAPVSAALRARGHSEFLVHTGQHYDYAMSQVFFDEMGLPEPDVNLEVGSGSHGWQTAQMLIRVEEVMRQQQPDWVLVYGDTNSTLSGALAACKLRIPLAHVEAGLRSFNRAMPEEHNRVLTDHCSDLLFCPTQTAVDNLAKEGITEGAHSVGDTMCDAILQFGQIARHRSTILQDLDLIPKDYLLATVHRPHNTDAPENLHSILTAFLEIDETIVFPVHPRTRPRIAELLSTFDTKATNRHLLLIDPVGYLDMIMLEEQARLIMTDSGGVQKEAYLLGVPCITLREETEWVETVRTGWNVIVGADPEQILWAVQSFTPPVTRPVLYGSGDAALRIAQVLSESA